IVAGPDIAVPIWPRISGPPVNKVQFCIVRASDPRGAATALPGIGAPRVASRFAGTRYRPEAPYALAGVGVVGIDEAADSVLCTGDSHHDEVLHNQWRDRRAISLLNVVYLGFPQNIAGLGI